MAVLPNALFSDPKSDAKKPLGATGRWGQVVTPEVIALRMCKRLLQGRPKKGVKILDPCVGPFTFPKVLVGAGVLHPADELTVIDIDVEMVAHSSWAEAKRIKFSAACCDYLQRELKPEYDYAILNPPYVRQEWLERKREYSALFRERYGLEVPGTSNLYVYFIAKVLKELRPGGRLACIVYDSWQSTRFGSWLAGVINAECSSVALESESNQPFNGRLIDATVIYAEKRAASNSESIAEQRAIPPASRGSLSTLSGFCPLTSVFQTRRGLRLKQSSFFLCDLKTAAKCGGTPFVKKVAKFDGYLVPRDHPEAALLMGVGEKNTAVKTELLRRLKEARLQPSGNVSILTWFKERPQSWMFHRRAPHADIIFNYYLRHRPKHILNPDRAYSDNFYGLRPYKRISIPAWLAALNSTAVCIEILSRARNQGSGLAKVQLFEYRDAHVPNITQLSQREISRLEKLGLALAKGGDAVATIRSIDELIASVFDDPRLRLRSLRELFKDVDRKARKPKETVSCLG